MHRRSITIAAVAAVVGWAAWLPLSAWLAGRNPGPVLTAALAVTYHAGSLVCHQHGARSFYTGATQWAVCARCVGLYAGAAAGAMAGLAWWWRRGADPGGAVRRLTWSRLAILVAAVPTAVLWGLDKVAGVPTSNVVRWAGALPLGAMVAAVIIAWSAGVAFDAPRPDTTID